MTVGLSTGLEYAPGIASNTQELIAIAEGMKDYAGLYATHCRNRSDAMDEAAAKAVTIAASAARLQMSHFIKRPNGTEAVSRKSWAILDRARQDGMSVFADVFPFDYGPTPLAVLLPTRLRVGGRAEMAAKLRDPTFKSIVLSGLGGMFDNAVKNDLVRSMYVADDGSDGSLVGLSLADVAEKTRLPAIEAAYWLLENAGEDFYCVTIVENWVIWSDLLDALEDKRFYIMGDGVTESVGGPGETFSLADWGYVPRFLSDFVRDSGRIDLADGIHRMSMGPARQVGLIDRGCLAVGQAADIVAFDLAAVGTDVAPSALLRVPKGIEHVWVNGTAVVRAGVPTDARPGRVGLMR